MCRRETPTAAAAAAAAASAAARRWTQPHIPPRMTSAIDGDEPNGMSSGTSFIVLNVLRCDRRASHRLRTRNRSSLLWCFPPWCPASTPAPSEGTHATPFVSLTTVGLSACLFSQSRAAADQMQICLPPLHPRALHCT